MRGTSKYVILLELLVIGLIIGCSSLFPNGGSINVAGPPNETVILQLDNSPASACCPPGQGCVVSAPVVLDENGLGSHSQLVDGDAAGNDPFWIANGVFTGCFGITTLPCSGVSSLSCQGGSARAFGTITVAGPGNGCRKIFFSGGTWALVCNNTTVTVNINGIAVSVLTGNQSTASSVAASLANQINSTQALIGVVVASATGSQVLVSGAQQSSDPSLINLYPWSTSCSHGGLFSGCGFSAAVAPISTMGTRPPL